jgi:hypothetical protein
MTEASYLLNKIRTRCIEEGDCLLWPGAVCTRGPVATVKGVQYSLRRVAWENKNGKPFPSGRVASPSCGNPRCLAHISAMTWAQLNTRPTSISHRVRTALARRKGSKLSDEAVNDIRYGGGRAEEAAERHNISAAYVYMIRRDQCRKDYSSPFHGLVKEAA